MIFSRKKISKFPLPLLRNFYAVFLLTAAVFISPCWSAYTSPSANSFGQVHPFIPFRNGHSNTVMNDGRVLMVGGK